MKRAKEFTDRALYAIIQDARAYAQQFFPSKSAQWSNAPERVLQRAIQEWRVNLRRTVKLEANRYRKLLEGRIHYRLRDIFGPDVFYARMHDDGRITIRRKDYDGTTVWTLGNYKAIKVETVGNWELSQSKYFIVECRAIANTSYATVYALGILTAEPTKVSGWVAYQLKDGSGLHILPAGTHKTRAAIKQILEQARLEYNANFMNRVEAELVEV